MNIKYPNPETKYVYRRYYRKRKVNAVLDKAYRVTMIFIMFGLLYGVTYISMVAAGCPY